jgi:hypothetical protein
VPHELTRTVRAADNLCTDYNVAHSSTDVTQTNWFGFYGCLGGASFYVSGIPPTVPGVNVSLNLTCSFAPRQNNGCACQTFSSKRYPYFGIYAYCSWSGANAVSARARGAAPPRSAITRRARAPVLRLVHTPGPSAHLRRCREGEAQEEGRPRASRRHRASGVGACATRGRERRA